MATKPLVRFQKSADVARTQRVLEDRLKPVTDCPLLSGRLIENIYAPATSSVTVNHGLDRQPRGWILTDIGDDANPSQIFVRTAWNTRTITFYNDMADNRTFSIWVF